MSSQKRLRSSFALLAPLALAQLLGNVACSSDAQQTSTTTTGAGATSASATMSSSSTTGSGGAGGAGGSGGATARPTLDTIVSQSLQSMAEHEPQVVVTKTGRVVVSYAASNPDITNFFHIGYRVSDDRGATWGEVTSITLPPNSNIASNTTLATDADGAVYLAYGSEQKTAMGVRSNQAVYLAKLEPSAATFAEPVLMTDPMEVVGVYDQPAITITAEGHLLLSYGQGSADLMSIWLVMQLSTDGGKTWTKNTPLMNEGPQTYENLAHGCAPKSGPAVYLYYADDYVGLTLWRSEDGGKTWDKTKRTEVDAKSEGSSVSFMLDGNCLADGNEVWAVYGLTDQPNAGGANVPRLTHIRLAHSSDGGATIDWRSSLEDKTAGKYFLLPRITFEGGSILDVTYYAGSGEGDKAATYRRARSTDGGKTFGASKLVHGPVTYELSRSTPQWFGDYMGLVNFEGDLYSAFIDNSGKASHVAFHRENAAN